MNQDLLEITINKKELNKISKIKTLINQIYYYLLTFLLTPILFLILVSIIGILESLTYKTDILYTLVSCERIFLPITSPLISSYFARIVVYRNLKQFNKLNEQVKKFNSIVKAIDVNDQLLEAGHKGFSSQERKQAIDFLIKVKAKLVIALKTERIFRENKDIVGNNNDFVINSLSELNIIQIDEKASEFGKLLSEAIKVVEEVEEEMINIKEMSNA